MAHCIGSHIKHWILLDLLFMQVLQDKVGAASQRTTDLETQLSSERERAVSAEEHGRSVERQLAEEQQNSDRMAKKREEAEAELAAQVTHDCRVPVKQQRPSIAHSAWMIHLRPSNLHACFAVDLSDRELQE